MKNKAKIKISNTFKIDHSKPTIFLYGQESEYRINIDSSNSVSQYFDYFFGNLKQQILDDGKYNLIESFDVSNANNIKKLTQVYFSDYSKFNLIII